MTFYNIMNGMNSKLAFIISCIVGKALHKEIPRFRDVFTGAEDCPIKDYDYLVYTRMGGGNYKHWSDCGAIDEDGNTTKCPFCELKEIEKDPNYLGGYDDDFDCTYRTLVFKFSDEQKKLFEKVKKEGIICVRKTNRVNISASRRENQKKQQDSCWS